MDIGREGHDVDIISENFGQIDSVHVMVTRESLTWQNKRSVTFSQ